jgi:hypothetical protein
VAVCGTAVAVCGTAVAVSAFRIGPTLT